MQFTTLHSSPEVKAAGLPFAVARIQPRVLIAAFGTEDDAVAYCDWLNNPEVSDADCEIAAIDKEAYLTWRKEQEAMLKLPKPDSELAKVLNEAADREEISKDTEKVLAAARETAARIKAEMQAKLKH